jgi:hypothetical protein
MYLDYGIKTNCIYAATIDAGHIYTDKTGGSPVISSTAFPVQEKNTS